MPEVETYLIVGLGNPGPHYARNRHNTGFRCLRRLAKAHGLEFRSRKRARVASGTIAGRSVLLVRPRTFMNESGQAVAPLVRFHQVPLDRLLVIYDDMDLPLGTLRLRPKGGSGGHRGMQSIIDALGSPDFPRLRIGIGRPPEGMDPADYVLQDFSPEEEPVIEEALERAVAAVETWLTEGIDEAMSRFNTVEEG
ncbi:MAG TPA: aminoacyl-tRNA hydrolase [Thermoflexia bacterium]|jgi:PTH1 family peptidyl-tRNA hydrolase|nr:aminoacyl-tRNA hydrolase [Thermoflexia bacterium]